jgi:ERCC4-type nuclease
LLERFGSVQSVVTASADDLAAVEGIGERTAAKIRWLLKGSGEELGTADLSRRAPSGPRRSGSA